MGTIVLVANQPFVVSPRRSTYLFTAPEPSILGNVQCRQRVVSYYQESTIGYSFWNPTRTTRNRSNTFLIASTMTNWTDFNPQDSLCPKDGPYGLMEEAFYYERNPGLYDWKNHEHYRLLEFPIAFQPEIGSASFPTMASLSRFMSAESLNTIPGYEKIRMFIQPGSITNFGIYQQPQPICQKSKE